MKNLDLGFKDVSFRNHVMNSTFEIAQRGTSFNSTPNPTPILDRWNVTFDGTTGTYLVGQSPLAPQDLIPGCPAQYLSWGQTIAPTGDTLRVLRQFIENVRTLSGKTCTLSFWASSDISRSIQVNLRQNFGTGGDASVEIPLQTVNLTSSWQKYTFQFDVPSLTGKTIGAVDNNLELRFWLPINATFEFSLVNVMLNEGTDAAPHQLMGGSIAGELVLCQRYFQIAGYGWVNYSGESDFAGTFNQTMRVNPTIYVFNTAVTFNILGISGGTCTFQNQVGASTTGAIIRCTGFTGTYTSHLNAMTSQGFGWDADF